MRTTKQIIKDAIREYFEPVRWPLVWVCGLLVALFLLTACGRLTNTGVHTAHINMADALCLGSGGIDYITKAKSLHSGVLTVGVFCKNGAYITNTWLETIK